MFTPRETYHDIRRAITTAKKSNAGKYFVSRVYSIKDGVKMAKSVKIARGHADFRGDAVRALLARHVYPGPTLETRLNRFIAAKYTAEIASRGGETEIEEKNRSVPLSVTDRDIKQGLVLLKAEGWRHYSNRFGARLAVIAYLCGRDDNGPFAVRVPGTVKTIAQAIDSLEPAEVKKARDAGRTVMRQGDVYVVEMTRDSARQADLPPRHTWSAESRMLAHEDGHAPLHVPFACKFVVQSALRMGRLVNQSRTGRGD